MIRKLFFSLAGMAMLLVSGAVQAAVDTIPYWNEGRWKVEAIPATRKCLADVTYTTRREQFFSLGFDAYTDGSAELLVFSPPWAKLYTEGRKYWVNVSFDNGKPHRLLAIAYSDGGLAFSDLTFDAIMAIAKSNSISFGYQGNILATLNLPGSYDALNKTIECANRLKSALQNDGTGPADEAGPTDGTGPADAAPDVTLAPLLQQPLLPAKPAPPAMGPTEPSRDERPTRLDL
jgi:hypothetical protein